jgi:hypothetical protein
VSLAQPALRVYLDQDVDVLLSDLLAAHGLDCQTALACGHIGWSDEAHLEFSSQDSRVIVTHNRRDFEQLALAWWGAKKEHGGIVLAFRRANTYDLVRHALPVLGTFDQQKWKNQLLYA